MACRAAVPPRRPDDAALPRTQALAPDVPNAPPTEACAGLGALDHPSPWSESLAEAPSTRPEHLPPPFIHFQSPSQSQNPTTGFVGSPSPALARLGDRRPPGTRARLVSGDLTYHGRERRRPKPLNPWALDLSCSPLIQRPGSLDTDSRWRLVPWALLVRHVRSWC
jgi:hypothetical protein